jgi:catechol 2,3-dioxygenase-like lactoylglutathione lyase family enzyme
MKIKSVSGITLYVKNLDKAAEFYESLGFEIRKREANHIAAYSNWFWMDFLAIAKEDRAAFKEEANLARKGGAAYFYFSVDNVDYVYKELVARGLKLTSEPQDSPFGNREFGLHDPDGYNLVFFKRR